MRETATSLMAAAAAAVNPLLYEHTSFVNGRLAMSGADLTQIAETHSTPTYVYSIPRVVQNYTAIHDAFKTHLDASSKLSIHYSLKANPSNAVVRALVQAGAGIDCVSAGEVFKAIHFGCPADHIVFAGVGKSFAEVDYAIERGIGWFNVENVGELDFIQTACEKHNRRANIALRVNPNVQANTHPSIATGHGGAKFGLPIAQVLEVLATKSKYTHLDFTGLHVHIGSQLGDVAPTVDAVTRVIGIAKSFEGITNINMGGGYPVRYRPDQGADELPKPDAFARAVGPLLKGFNVMLEPGRSIIADAGILLTRSIYRKDQNNMTMLIVDASMVEVMRPALYGAYHDVVPLQETTSEDAAAQGTVMTTIVGPVCESTDVISKGVVLPASAVKPGQLFAVMTVGAYCSCMAGNYNARPLCTEVVVVEGGQTLVSRKRQTFEDLVRDEVNPFA